MDKRANSAEASPQAETPSPHAYPMGDSIKTGAEYTIPHTDAPATPPPPNSPTPPSTCDAYADFENLVILRQLSGGVKSGRWRVFNSAWAKVRQFLTSSGLDVHTIGFRPQIAYSWLEQQRLSPNYAAKIIRLLNFWGEYVAEKSGKPYPRIPPPTGYARQRIADSFSAKVDAGAKTQTSRPLDERLLSRARKSMRKEHYRWLYVSLWLGLRPSEVDALHSPSSYRYDVIEGTPVLMVYQSKLKRIPKDKRWKCIPLVLRQQRAAYRVIQSGNFRRPSASTLHRHLGEQVHTYAGRKGFSDLLMTKGVSLEAASLMLGHKNVEMTLAHYANPVKVQLERIRKLNAK